MEAFSNHLNVVSRTLTVLTGGWAISIYMVRLLLLCTRRAEESGSGERGRVKRPCVHNPFLLQSVP